MLTFVVRHCCVRWIRSSMQRPVFEQCNFVLTFYEKVLLILPFCFQWFWVRGAHFQEQISSLESSAGIDARMMSGVPQDKCVAGRDVHESAELQVIYFHKTLFSISAFFVSFVFFSRIHFFASAFCGLDEAVFVKLPRKLFIWANSFVDSQGFTCNRLPKPFRFRVEYSQGTQNSVFTLLQEEASVKVCSLLSVLTDQQEIHPVHLTCATPLKSCITTPCSDPHFIREELFEAVPSI